MDVTPYLDLKPAPRAVFDALDERRDQVRFQLPTGEAGGWQPVTWGDFAGQIRQVALFLQALGLKREARAAIYAPNRVEWLSAALGIQAAGGCMVPIYPASTAPQAAYVIEHSDSEVVFVDTTALLARLFEAPRTAFDGVRQVVLLDDGLQAELERLRRQQPGAGELADKVISFSQALARGAALDAERPELFDAVLGGLKLDQLGLMLYTSGTTGAPKGVPLTYRNVASNGRDWLECNAPLLPEDAVDLLWLPMSHIFGFGEACLGNTLGWVTYLSDPATVLERLVEVRPHIFMSVPAYWEKLAIRAQQQASGEDCCRKLKQLTGGRLSFCLSGGAGLKQEVKELFHSCGLLIIEGYGLTESSPTLTLNRPDAFRFDSVGKPLPSVELKLAEDGEILARGPNVFGGYHKNAAASAEVLTADGWLRTGDIGRFTEDGFLQIVDRKKEILVTAGGKNVPPANIEGCFADDPLIDHVVIYGDGHKYLVAGVWLNQEELQAQLAQVEAEGRDAAVQQLVAARIEKANSGLARFEQIRRFHIMAEPLTVEGGLLTSTLKIRRKKIYEAFGQIFESLYE